MNVAGASFIAPPWGLEAELRGANPWGDATQADDGSPWTKEDDDSKWHLEGLIGSLGLEGSAAAWKTPTQVVLCPGETDELLPSNAYGALWRHSNVSVELWTPDSNRPMPHTAICWRTKGSVQQWASKTLAAP